MAEWVEVTLRTLMVMAALFIVTKILGKRQVNQLSLFEYLTGITIGSIAATTSMDLRSDWYFGLVALGVWGGVVLITEIISMKSKKARDFFEGKGTVLIKGGKILEENLKKERMNVDELMEQLRANKIFKIADVEFAVMESSGKINTLLTAENQPLTPKHLGVKVAPEQEPQLVISDGVILDEPLATIGRSREWLNTELEKLGIAVENVFIGQVDTYGELYVDLYDDQIQTPQPMNRANLLATLKKCEADLELFGLSTNNKEAKAMYEQCSKQLQDIISELKPILHQ